MGVDLFALSPVYAPPILVCTRKSVRSSASVFVRGSIIPVSGILSEKINRFRHLFATTVRQQQHFAYTRIPRGKLTFLRHSGDEIKRSEFYRHRIITRHLQLVNKCIKHRIGVFIKCIYLCTCAYDNN